MKRFRFCLLLLLGSLPLPSSASAVLYTTHNGMPSNVPSSIDVIYLNATEQLQDSWLLSQQMEFNEKNVSQLRTLLQGNGWKTQETKLLSAYQDLIQAWQLGIAKTPALVLDNRYVIYGMTDVTQALVEINRFQLQQESLP